MDGQEDTTLQGRDAELNSDNNADAENIDEKSTDSSSAEEETAGTEEEAAAGDHNVVGLEKVDATGEVSKHCKLFIFIRPRPTFCIFDSMFGYNYNLGLGFN